MISTNRTPQSPISKKVWQTYLEFLQRLKTESPAEYNHVPTVLKHFTSPEIQLLKTSDIQALQAMNALPERQPETLNTEQRLAAQSYIRTLRKLKDDPKEYAKIPAILKVLSDDEIEHITPEALNALRFLGALPETLFQSGEASMEELNEALNELVKTNPDLAKVANLKDAVKFAKHPAVVALMKNRPEFQRMINREIEKKLNPFLEPGRTKLENHPYETHPYGEETTPAPPMKFLDLGWLLNS